MQLLGFETEDELNNWRNESTNNEEFYKLLDLAQAGDIIRLNWNNETNNLMIVQHNDELAFYSIEERILLGGDEMNGFTLGSSKSLLGAGILNYSSGDNYEQTSDFFGNVEMDDFTLPQNWNRSPDSAGGVVIVRPTTWWQAIGYTASLTASMATIIGGYVKGNQYAVYGGQAAMTAVIANMNARPGTPVYFDHLPYTN
jgi:hypothetical protein